LEAFWRDRRDVLAKVFVSEKTPGALRRQRRSQGRSRSAKAHRAEIAKARERLVVPPDAEIVAKLAKHDTNKALGDIAVLEDGKNRVLDFGE
jgi:hypothetical protein